MSVPTYTHRVYSEGNAGRWQGIPGYLVRGSSIYCATQNEARRIANNIAAVAVTVTTEDGIYYYTTQEDADDDDTGTAAVAVVYALDAEEIAELG